MLVVLIGEKYLKNEELREFLEAVNCGLYGDKEAFYLFAFSGLRSGELCALNGPTLTSKLASYE
ncbi:hypothetical protein EIM92_13775 [Paenibacillus lentus]|uniref:Tyr recombinase domain-containing protein n=1 Tax=Paenibacillus lentus TaxID=1338368 RepID=A0A3Q8SBV0_9BACL|nr:hypothetical protein EIM92_13775 [Paenibacillus lentus]